MFKSTKQEVLVQRYVLTGTKYYCKKRYSVTKLTFTEILVEGVVGIVILSTYVHFASYVLFFYYGLLVL